MGKGIYNTKETKLHLEKMSKINDLQIYKTKVYTIEAGVKAPVVHCMDELDALVRDYGSKQVLIWWEEAKPKITNEELIKKCVVYGTENE